LQTHKQREQASKDRHSEGGEEVLDSVKKIVSASIPVMGHLGLQPQSVNAYGGYRVQGRGSDAARAIVEDAVKLQELGAFAVVLECIPAALAGEITAALRIPTIGIGAGAGCDGQILVLQDLLGMNMDFTPKFVRRFADTGRCILDAVGHFDQAVKAGSFPAAAESYE
jgi:3-methyl-2-oxobutanoate hydroxymethyltransferase